jgi:hypothetical protein
MTDIARADVYALLTDQAMWEKVARSFHSHYERLAPEFGYEVRPDVGQRPFSELPENNRRLMVTTAGHVLRDVLDLLDPPQVTEVHSQQSRAATFGQPDPAANGIGPEASQG